MDAKLYNIYKKYIEKHTLEEAYSLVYSDSNEHELMKIFNNRDQVFIQLSNNFYEHVLRMLPKSLQKKLNGEIEKYLNELSKTDEFINSINGLELEPSINFDSFRLTDR